MYVLLTSIEIAQLRFLAFNAIVLNQCTLNVVPRPLATSFPGKGLGAGRGGRYVLGPPPPGTGCGVEVGDCRRGSDPATLKGQVSRQYSGRTESRLLPVYRLVFLSLL